MRKSALSLVACVAFAANAFAGVTVGSQKQYKEYAVAPEPCIPDREWQVDVFASYAFTDSEQERIIGDHAWGGGLGINYYFTRWFGLGLEGQWLDARDERDNPGSAALNLFLRYAPMEPAPMGCWAVYVYGGPDVVFNTDTVFEDDDEDDDDNSPGFDEDEDALFAGHVGIGLEYRFVRNVGIFTDARYTFVEKSDNDYATVRAGLRFAF